MGTSCAQCCIVGAEWNLLVSELLVPGTFGRLRKSCYNNMSNALHSLVHGLVSPFSIRWSSWLCRATGFITGDSSMFLQDPFWHWPLLLYRLLLSIASTVSSVQTWHDSHLDSGVHSPSQPTRGSKAKHFWESWLNISLHIWISEC